MLETRKAAEYLIVAWCKDWKMHQYLGTVTETTQVWDDDLMGLLAEATVRYPWLTMDGHVYKHGVREFVSRAYPKLNTWLWSRSDDLARLKAAPQVEKLRPVHLQKQRLSNEDMNELLNSQRATMAKSQANRLSREAFKTNQRSAWNVCKG